MEGFSSMNCCMIGSWSSGFMVFITGWPTTCLTTATAACAAVNLIFSKSDMNSSGMYFRTSFSISSLEMLVMRPASYRSAIHLWIRETPG